MGETNATTNGAGARIRAHEAELHLAAIVENSDDAIVSTDLNGNIVSWNHAATRLYGYTTEEAIGRPFDIVIPEDEERRRGELGVRERVARGEVVEHYETVRRHKSGRLIDVSLSISPVRDPSGTIIAAAGFARDISERKRLEVTQYLAGIVESADDAIVSKSLDGTILSWNNAATEMYGYAPEEAIGQPIDIVIPDDAERRAEELSIRRRIAKGEKIKNYETIRRRKDGSQFDAFVSISPVRNAAGDIVAAAGFARDNSERRIAFQNSQFLAAIIEHSDSAIVSKDLTGTIMSWNEAATRMYGYTAAEAIGQPIEIVIPEDDERRAEELRIRDQLARGEPIDHYETMRRHKSGRLIEVLLTLSPVRNTKGEIIAAAGFARDISGERRAFETSQFLAAIVQNSDDAIVSKDLDGTIRSWNDAATEMYGYTRDEAEGQPIDIVIPDSDERRAEELSMREKIRRGERIDHHETIRRHKSGRMVEASLTISPVRDAEGNIIAAAGFARDISQRKHFETAQYLAAIVDSSDDAIVSTTIDGTIRSWNDAATVMYGYTREEAEGQPIDIVIPEDGTRRDEELRMRAGIKRGDRIDHYETIRRTRDGSSIEVSLSMSPVRDASGAIIAAADIARDISERKRLEQDRVRATGLLMRFNEFAAHDFKTPMQNILMNAQEAQYMVAQLGDVMRNPRLATLLNRIEANAVWMNKRTEGLLRASTLGNSQKVRTRVSANAVFDESYAVLKGVDQFVQSATVERADLPEVASDETLLGFLFQNLVQNAGKYGRVGEHVIVSVTAQRNGDAWEFAVQDNGMGIKPEMQRRIFEPHVRDPDSGRPGSGIGLDLCRTIVLWHGGDIWVESAGVGYGSIFRFTIPD